MKTFVEILLQFGVSGAALAVLAFYMWIHGRVDRSSSKRWEEMAQSLKVQNQQIVEIVRMNTDVLREAHTTMAVVRDRLT